MAIYLPPANLSSPGKILVLVKCMDRYSLVQYGESAQRTLPGPTLIHERVIISSAYISIETGLFTIIEG